VTASVASASYAVRAIKPYTSYETMRMVYFSYFHSIMTYGLISWGNSPLCIRIFRLQKRLIRIITNSGSRDSCRELFKKLKVLPLYSQYILSLSLFMVKNIYFYLILRFTQLIQEIVITFIILVIYLSFKREHTILVLRFSINFHQI
jgi:hypothetical protein